MKDFRGKKGIATPFLFLILVGFACGACPGPNTASDKDSFRSLLLDNSTTEICIDTFFQIPWGEWGEVVDLNRSVLVYTDTAGAGFNNSMNTLFRLKDGLTVVLRELFIAEGFHGTKNDVLFAADSPGTVQLENVTWTGFCYDLTPLEFRDIMAVLFTRDDDDSEFPLDLMGPDGFYALNPPPKVSRFHVVTDEYSYIGTFQLILVLRNVYFSCIPRVPPYIYPLPTTIDSVMPHQLVCQNRSDKGYSYRGYASGTSSGRRCQSWTSMKPYYHDFVPWNFQKHGLTDGARCRNPSALAVEPQDDQVVWCFTQERNTRKENCTVPFCEDMTAQQIMTAYNKIVDDVRNGRDPEPQPPLPSAQQKDLFQDRVVLSLVVVLPTASFVVLVFIALALLVRKKTGPKDTLAGLPLPKDLTSIVVQSSVNPGTSRGPGGPHSGDAMLNGGTSAADGAAGAAGAAGGSDGAMSDGTGQGPEAAPASGVQDALRKAFLLQSSRITVKERIDEGGSGTVYLGQWENTPVALKVLNQVDENAGIDEALLGIMLVHPNVVRLYGFFRAPVQPGSTHASTAAQIERLLFARGSAAELITSAAAISFSSAQFVNPSISLGALLSRAVLTVDLGKEAGALGTPATTTGSSLPSGNSEPLSAKGARKGREPERDQERLSDPTGFEGRESVGGKGKGGGERSAGDSAGPGPGSEQGKGGGGAGGAGSSWRRQASQARPSTGSVAASQRGWSVKGASSPTALSDNMAKAGGGGSRPATPNAAPGDAAGSEAAAIADAAAEAPAASRPVVVCLVMDYCDLGSLFHWLAKGATEAALAATPGSPAVPGVPDLRRALALARQVATGCAHLHDRGIVHGDLKSLNVLLKSTSSSPGCPQALVADFGTSKFLNQSSKNMKVTRMYLAPEVLSTRTISFAADVYALGIILFELFQPKWMTWPDSFRAPLGETIYVPMPAPIARLIARCTALKPEARPAMKDVASEIIGLQGSLGLTSGPSGVAGPAGGPSDRMTSSDLLILSARCPFVTGPLRIPVAQTAHDAGSLQAFFYRALSEPEAAFILPPNAVAIGPQPAAAGDAAAPQAPPPALAGAASLDRVL